MPNDKIKPSDLEVEYGSVVLHLNSLEAAMLSVACVIAEGELPHLGEAYSSLFHSLGLALRAGAIAAVYEFHLHDDNRDSANGNLAGYWEKLSF